MKKTWKNTLVIITILTLVFILCGCNEIDRYNFAIAPLCVHSPMQNLTVERDTNIHVYRHSNGSSRAEIAETFYVYNDGEETTVMLIYPSLINHSEEIDFRVDGEPSTDWWGAANANEAFDITYLGKDIDKLNDGTFFDRAFPDWPELGEQKHSIDPDPKYNWITDMCGISYFVKEVTIPENGTVTVTASFEGRAASMIRIFRLADEITCTRHSLTVDTNPFGDFEGIGIEDQNVIDEMPDSNTWTAVLDPAREDYFIKVCD